MNDDTCILVTGSKGFIGKNLISHLNELTGITITEFVRGDDSAKLPGMVAKADAIIHLAGENRPVDESAFAKVNLGLTALLCDAITQEFAATGRQVTFVLASSTQAEQDNHYGRSKLNAEKELQALANTTGNPCIIFRLPGVFGKWCKPNYNSVVATFCYNFANDIPIQINDPKTSIKLVYIDDVVNALLAALDSPSPACIHATLVPEYNITLGELAAQIGAFGNCRNALIVERVGIGFARALYATYLSYLPSELFSYEVERHEDKRGTFVEMIKTQDSGQFSYFMAHPGVTRGGHYHNTKTEKFLVIKGDALIRLRHILTGELVELFTSGDKPRIVDTIPGWSHDITNVGDCEMYVICWANENFDRQNPDTFTSEV